MHCHGLSQSRVWHCSNKGASWADNFWMRVYWEVLVEWYFWGMTYLSIHTFQLIQLLPLFHRTIQGICDSSWCSWRRLSSIASGVICRLSRTSCSCDNKDQNSHLLCVLTVWANHTLYMPWLFGWIIHSITLHSSGQCSGVWNACHTHFFLKKIYSLLSYEA